MQKIARELNLAETAFVLPATREDCVARVRIFTPAKELAFAGHPTIGTAFVLLQEEIISRNSSEFSVEEEVGPIPIRIEGGQRPLIWFRMPPIREGRCYGSSLRESSGAGTAGPVANEASTVQRRQSNSSSCRER
jgi:trans-2,3-dihydro-3-hydroxyanthranilate isomerase